LAEIVGEYVKKGSKLYIEGRLQTSSWDDKESGQKKYRTEVIANDLVLLSSRGEGDEAGGSRAFSRGAASSGNSFDQRGPDDSLFTKALVLVLPEDRFQDVESSLAALDSEEQRSAFTHGLGLRRCNKPLQRCICLRDVVQRDGV